MENLSNIKRLKRFVHAFTRVLDSTDSLPIILDDGKQLLSDLISVDDWLPPDFSKPYEQNLLYGDPYGRFFVMSFTWGPEQITPIHDHSVWGLIGILRGGEYSQEYVLRDGLIEPEGELVFNAKGTVSSFLPPEKDLHQVMSVPGNEPGVSIHVYGGNIGEIPRRIYSRKGIPSEVITGYHNIVLPNIWS